MRFLASLVLLVSVLGIARADAVDDLVSAEMKKQGIPGLSLVVLKDGKPVKTKGYGEANLEHHVPVKPETMFQSGSVGKQFTATLVMMLVGDGKLTLDSAIGQWFPEAQGKWDKILLRHLLSHTSGLPDMPYDKMDLRKDYTEAELVMLMVSQPAVKPPGTEWRYNNGGYVMLGVLVHRLTGRFYGDLLKERIFTPLGMTTARVISERDIVPNRASGYEMQTDGLKNQEWVSPVLNTTADGSLYLSGLDYAKWDAGLRGARLLKKSVLEQMWTPMKLADGTVTKYGFGWQVASHGGSRLIEHSGAWQGFTTYIGRMVDGHYSVIVLTNLDAGHSNPVKIGHGVLDIYGPRKTS